MVSDVTAIDRAACLSVIEISPANESAYETSEVIDEVDVIGKPSDFTLSAMAQFHIFTNINASSAPMPSYRENLLNIS